MSKLLAYICRNCSYKAIKWLGCCPECKEWNSFDQEKYSDIKNQHKAVINSPIVMQSLASQERKKKERMTTDISEWDRVTGGGIMPGAFVVLTGDPGIGKSTLLLQIAHKLASKYKVFYFSSEESLEQVCLRAERLRCLSDSSFSIRALNFTSPPSSKSHGHSFRSSSSDSSADTGVKVLVSFLGSKNLVLTPLRSISLRVSGASVAH